MVSKAASSLVYTIQIFIISVTSLLTRMNRSTSPNSKKRLQKYLYMFVNEKKSYIKF